MPWTPPSRYGSARRNSMPEHQRRQVLNGYLGRQVEWTYPSDDPDCLVKVPYGPHQGKTLGDLLETHPQYIAWLTGPKCSHTKSPFTEALFRVAKRYAERLKSNTEAKS